MEGKVWSVESVGESIESVALTNRRSHPTRKTRQTLELPACATIEAHLREIIRTVHRIARRRPPAALIFSTSYYRAAQA
jgi:hypothetical protein